MLNYKELKIWQKGIEIVKAVYLVSEQITDKERYGLISQINRAAVSIPANIAEGSSRKSDRDYHRFLEIALGSAFELETLFVILKEIKVVDEKKVDLVLSMVEEEQKMINAFLSTLRTTIKGFH